MKFRIPRKLKKRLKKYKWKKNGESVKPWKNQSLFDDYKANNLDVEFWKSTGRIL